MSDPSVHLHTLTPSHTHTSRPTHTHPYPQEKRIESCNKIKEALGRLPGEFSGKYYPLEGMSEADRVKLVEDHFLFKKGDRFLESAGINRDWPVGRGIFHNDQKTFLVWTHEEDVLRIISMQPGGDIAEVFNRLSTALDHLDKVPVCAAARRCLRLRLHCVCVCVKGREIGRERSTFASVPCWGCEEPLLLATTTLLCRC